MSKEDSSGEGKLQDASTPDTSTKDPNADIYDNRKSKKIIRVVTVIAYLFSVSFVGILLSTYYIFLWEPPNPRLMQHKRPRTDPQIQFLLASPSEETDLTTKDSNLLPQNEVSWVHKSFLGRMTQDIYDDNDSVVDSRDKTNLEKKQRLNMVLLKLRHSLVDILRAENRNLSQEISRGFNNSVGVERVHNSTIDRAENTISRYADSRGNISERKTYNDNADLPPEFADSVSMPHVESKSSTSKFTGTETSQIHFDSVTNPIIEEKNHKEKHDTVDLYLAREFSNATNSDATNGSDQHAFGDNDSFKMIKEFLKIGRKGPMKQNKTDDRRLVGNHRENYSGDIQTSVTLEKRVNSSIGNSRENYSNNNESSTDQIGRDIVSIDSSSHNLGFTDDPKFHQMPDDPTVIKSRPRTMRMRDSEGERIHADPPALLTAGINTVAGNVTV